MGRFSRERKSEVLGYEIGYMEMGMRVIRFYRKYEFWIVVEVNRDVGYDE